VCITAVHGPAEDSVGYRGARGGQHLLHDPRDPHPPPDLPGVPEPGVDALEHGHLNRRRPHTENCTSTLNPAVGIYVFFDKNKKKKCNKLLKSLQDLKKKSNCL